MRFVAALDTKVFGIPHAAGTDVDVTGWDRKQLLYYLGLGVIAPVGITAGALSDVILFEGADVSTHTNEQGQTVVTIDFSPQGLDWLTDVDTSSAMPSDNQMLAWSDELQLWRPFTPAFSTVTLLSELEDVDITIAPDEGDVLQWGITGWFAGPAPAYELSQLADVQLDADTPVDGDIIVWDGVAQKWINAAASFVGEPGPVPFTVLGEWSSALVYAASPAPAAAVTRNGSLYMAIAPSTNKDPAVFPAYWRLLAAKGEQGATGATGTNGTNGAAGSTGPQGPIGKVVPAGGTYSIHGTAIVMTGDKKLYNDTGSTLTITKVRSAAGTGPATVDFIADIHKNGTTIFTNQANRPTITAGQTTDLTGAPDVTSWADGEYLTLDVDQTGDGTANVTITVVCS